MTNQKLPLVEAAYDKSFLNFSKGIPGFSILPTEELSQASIEFAQKKDSDYLTYGHWQGNGYLRRSLAHFLTKQLGFSVDMDELFITSGNSQTIDIACSMYASPGDSVLVEELTYFLALDIFKSQRLNPIPVRVDEQGLDPDSLESILKREKVAPKFLYVIPAFSNPTGYNLSEERKERIVELSEKYGFKILADEVYQMLYFNHPPPPSFGKYIESDQVVSAGTFSKILAPGVRLGWIHGSPQVIKEFENTGIAISAGAYAQFSTGPVLSVLDSGLQLSYLNRIKEIFKRRCDLMDAGIKAHFPESVTYQKPEGGYFFWLEFPDGVKTDDYVSGARELGVGFTPGRLCSAEGQHHNCMRLSYAFYEEDDIEMGIEKLGRYLKSQI